MTIKKNLLSQSIVEDVNNAKNYYVGKIMPCHFFKFLKLKTKKCSLDKTREGNVVLDLEISA